ncbi:hypothetical protein Dda_4993 [Drechslerella dactyloides]|uniref:Uncharacterized protein n=1 Tax=Drechslerella dactyloides TaxID=74499 RepID=A0AAD6IZE8_DREDA|nr:hypothetical protein Dda_4993 [Drechslerella dactyloides]
MLAQRRQRRTQANRNRNRKARVIRGREIIELKFRLKEGSHGPTSSHEAYAHETLAHFVDSLISTFILVHAMEQGLMVTVGEMFQGGEIIHWRIYDETGQEMEDLTVDDYERRIGRRIMNPVSREIMGEVLNLMR